MTPIERMRAAVEKARQMGSLLRYTGPAPDKEINRVEKTLGVPISGSYREFIRLLGSQNDYGFCGVNMEYGDKGAGTLWGTQLMRQYNGVPIHYLMVWVNEGISEAYIMDCSDPQPDGEFPVYWVFLDDWENSRDRVADSFIEFVEHYYEISPSPARKPSTAKPGKATRMASTKRPATARKKPSAKKKSPKRGKGS